jgi:hypothetical protein
MFHHFQEELSGRTELLHVALWSSDDERTSVGKVRARGGTNDRNVKISNRVSGPSRGSNNREGKRCWYTLCEGSASEYTSSILETRTTP